jgi:hypothetical protein
MTIRNTILEYPRRIALPAEPFGVRIFDWDEFAADNADDPEMVDDVAIQIAVHGYANIGGGAGPLITIRRG